MWVEHVYMSEACLCGVGHLHLGEACKCDVRYVCAGWGNHLLLTGAQLGEVHLRPQQLRPGKIRFGATWWCKSLSDRVDTSSHTGLPVGVGACPLLRPVLISCSRQKDAIPTSPASGTHWFMWEHVFPSSKGVCQGSNQV